MKIGEQRWSQISNKVYVNVLERAWEKLSDQTNDEVWGKIRDEIWVKTDNQIPDQIRIRI